MKRKLHAQNPSCYWCYRVTVLLPLTSIPKHQIGEMATVDHIKSRPECASADEWRHPDNKVLACSKCNSGRNRAFLLNHPEAKSPFSGGRRTRSQKKKAQKKKAQKKKARKKAKMSPPGDTILLW